MIDTICPTCKKEFKTHPYRFKNSKQVFCSRQCSHESYKLPEELKAQRRKEYREKNKEDKAIKDKIYYKENINKIKKLQREHYQNNKDDYLKRAAIAYKKRKLRWQNNEEFRIKESQTSTLWQREKRKKDLEWKEKKAEERRKSTDEAQLKTLEAIPDNNGRPWTQGDVEYLIENYKKKTYIELAIDLGRTMLAVKAKLDRIEIKRKNNKHYDNNRTS